MKRTEIGVALLGFGNVGSGTYKALEENFALIEKKVGAKVVIKKILVRNLNAPRRVEAPAELFTTDFEEILRDPKIDIVAVQAETGTYRSKLVISDIYGASSELSFQYTILENHVPEAVQKMPDQIFNARSQVLELKESDFFKDDDGEQLAYTITNTDENVANVNYSKGVFYITSLNLGYSEVTVTATDIRGKSVTQTFRILVRDSQEAVDIYPNPVRDYLYVRTSVSASAELKLVNALGYTVFEESLTISPFEPARVDLREVAGGTYTVQVEYEGETISKTIVKL